MPGPILRFNDTELDVGRYEIRRNGRWLRLERLPMELLILLASRQGELVTREEVIERLWGKGVHLDVDQGINTAVRKIRMCLRDTAENPTYIQTVVGKGYRFIPPVSISQPAIVTAPVEALPKIEDPDPPRQHLHHSLNLASRVGLLSPRLRPPRQSPASSASGMCIESLGRTQSGQSRCFHSTIFPEMRPRTTSWMV